jgi:hypothetical protein
MEGMAAPDGALGPDLKNLYQDLASGGVGLISTSACFPDPEWMNASHQSLRKDVMSFLSYRTYLSANNKYAFPGRTFSLIDSLIVRG